MSAPFMAKWDGEVFRPLPRFAGTCQKHYRPEVTYALAEPDDHSEINRGHYFACVKKAWLNLPEAWGDRFPTVDILRKWALIRAGYCDQIVCENRAEALRWINRIREHAGYAEIGTAAGVVVILTAQSQRKKAMGHKKFTESKQAVLEILASMIDVPVDELTKQDAA